MGTENTVWGYGKAPYPSPLDGGQRIATELRSDSSAPLAVVAIAPRELLADLAERLGPNWTIGQYKSGA
jgi:hypothetical protein